MRTAVLLPLQGHISSCRVFSLCLRIHVVDRDGVLQMPVERTVSSAPSKATGCCFHLLPATSVDRETAKSLALAWGRAQCPNYPVGYMTWSPQLLWKKSPLILRYQLNLLLPFMYPPSLLSFLHSIYFSPCFPLLIIYLVCTQTPSTYECLCAQMGFLGQSVYNFPQTLLF